MQHGQKNRKNNVEKSYKCLSISDWNYVIWFVSFLSVKSENKIYWPSRASLMVQWVKSLPAMQETQEMRVWSLGWEDILEEEMETLSNILVWKIPCIEEPGRLQSGVAKSQTWLNIFTTIKLKMAPFFKQHWCKVIRILIESILLNSYQMSLVHNSQTSNVSIVKVQFGSVAQSCPTLWTLWCSMPGLSVHHQLPEFTQTHVHRVGNAIQPSHPLSSPSPPAPNPSHHQSLFQWVNSLHEEAKVLEFQL